MSSPHIFLSKACGYCQTPQISSVENVKIHVCICRYVKFCQPCHIYLVAPWAPTKPAQRHSHNAKKFEWTVHRASKTSYPGANQSGNRSLMAHFRVFSTSSSLCRDLFQTNLLIWASPLGAIDLQIDLPKRCKKTHFHVELQREAAPQRAPFPASLRRTKRGSRMDTKRPPSTCASAGRGCHWASENHRSTRHFNPQFMDLFFISCLVFSIASHTVWRLYVSICAVNIAFELEHPASHLPF